MKIRILSLSVVMALICSTISVYSMETMSEVEQFPLVDVAVNKPVYVSSELLGTSGNSGDFCAGSSSYMVDNLEHSDNRSSGWIPETTDASPTAIVDLTVDYVIHRVDIQYAVGNKVKVSASKTKDGGYVVLDGRRTNLYGTHFNIEMNELVAYRYLKVEKDVGSEGDFQIYDFKAYAPRNTNLTEVSLGKPIITSCTEVERNASSPAATINPNVITDGVQGTYSAYVLTSGSGAYVTVDLEKVENVKRIEFTSRGLGTGIMYWWPSQRNNVNFYANDNVTLADNSDTIMANGTLIAQYAPANGLPFAPPYGTIAFDIENLHTRYITLIGMAHIAEVRVFADTVGDAPSQTFDVENVAVDKTVAKVTNNEDTAVNLVDENTTTSWETQDNNSSLILDLGATYNIEKIGLIAGNESGKSNFVIFGGHNPSDFNSMLPLCVQGDTAYVGEKFAQDVKTTNAVRFIMLRPTIKAQTTQAFAELEVYAQSGKQLTNVALNKISSNKNINNGSYSSFDGAEDGSYPEGLANGATGTQAPAFYIDLGANTQLDKVKFTSRTDLWNGASERSFKIMASKNQSSDYVEIAKVDRYNMPVFSAITFDINTAEPYRYIAVVKDLNKMSGGVFDSVTSTKTSSAYNEGVDLNNHLYVPELQVFEKTAATVKPKAPIKVTGMSFVDKNGNSIQNLNGDLGATASFKNNTKEQKSAIFILALYNQKGLIVNYSSKIVTLNADELKTEKILLTNNLTNIANGYKLKSFYWESLSGHKSINLHKELVQEVAL